MPPDRATYEIKPPTPKGTPIATLLPRTVQRLAEAACGDTGLHPRRSGPDLVKLFNKFGCNAHYGDGFPSRNVFALGRVRELNGNSAIIRLIEHLFDPLDYQPPADPEHEVKLAIEDINEYLERDGLEVFVTPTGAKVRTIAGAAVAMNSAPVTPASRTFVDEHLKKCEAKLREGDFAGAITNARSLCEDVLRDVEAQRGGMVKYDGDFGKLFRRVRDLLGFDRTGSTEQSLQQILGGLSSVVGGLAAVSNAMGDRHGGRRFTPQRQHAELAINCSNTLCVFMLETHRVTPPSGV
jgi:Abortive infection C-terminus